jgi:muramoyltetrapeptide carboxypeptidase
VIRPAPPASRAIALRWSRPASAFKPEDLEAGVRELQRLGFEAVYDERDLRASVVRGGPAAVRARVLREAWRDPSVAALLAVRGGYGSQQLLPLLEPEVMRHAAKLLIGYSDITALLCWSCAHGVVSLHGPMIEGRLSSGPAAYDEASFLRATMVAEPMGELAPAGLEAFAPGEASGMVVGGTLAQLVSLLGTPWAFDVPRGAILFLEDVGERPYRIHRMLTQLAQSGMLARAGALVFGEFPRCDEPGGEPRSRTCCASSRAGSRAPCCSAFPPATRRARPGRYPSACAAACRARRRWW